MLESCLGCNCMSQLDLFQAIADVYSESDMPMANRELYKRLISKLRLPDDTLKSKSVVGNSSFNEFKRKVRWFQQTLKQAGVLSRIEGARGSWTAVKKKESELDKILPNFAVIGFSTKLGVAIIGYSESVFAKINEPIHLILTSPPFPLANARKYGNVAESEYVDWICKTLEPVVKNLVDGGVLTLNISNDIFMHKSAARSLYRERLVLALNDKLGLRKMDELIWINTSKPPGPYQYASKRRVQLNVGWEPIYYFTNNPDKVIADNRRVLQPHTKEHLKFIESGGAKKAAVKSDGAYRLYEGSYSNKTEGKIPKNIIVAGTACAENRRYKRDAEASGFQSHGAMMPDRVVEPLIKLFTNEGELVVDPFGGSIRTGRTAERLNRRWICVDPVFDYVMGGATRFEGFEGVKINGSSGLRIN